MSTPAMTKPKKKKLQMPPLIVFLFIFLCIVTALTWVIPAGQFQMDPETKMYLPNSYQRVEQNPIGPWEMMCTILPAFTAAGTLIMMVLISGGTIGLILSTGSIDHVIDWFLNRMYGKGLTVLIPAVSIMMSALGALGGGDSFIAFIPVGLALAHKLRLDKVCGVAIIYGCTFVGLATSPKGQVPNAQIIADVPYMSGAGMRMVGWAVCTAIMVLYTLAYAKRIQKDPSKSILGPDWVNDLPPEVEKHEVKAKPAAFITVIMMFACYAFIAVSSSLFGWAYPESNAIMIIMAILAAIINRMSMKEFSKRYIDGVRGIAQVAVIMGTARTISLVMENGKIIHTLVNWLTMPLGFVGKGGAIVVIYLINLFFNLITSSGSAQAAIMMPLMIPLGDTFGITRQVLCSAFAYGDGLFNMCTPVGSTCMGSMGLAKMNFTDWVKFYIPAVAMMSVFIGAFLVYLTSIGWTGV